MNPGRWPLAVQLALGFALVTALALLGGGALLLGQVQETQLAERSRTLLAQANAASNLVVEVQQSGGGQQEVSLALWRFQQQTGARPVAVDMFAVATADSVAPSPLLGQKLTHPEVAAALRGEQVTGTRWLSSGDWVMYGAVPVYRDRGVTGAVLLAADLNPLDEALDALRRQLALVALAAGAMSIAAGAALARYLARPLAGLSRAAEALSHGRLETRVSAGGSSEVTRLGESFNRMASELGRLEQQRRSFVADASHELRTPVASIRALAEGLLAHTQGTPETHREYLEDIVRESERAGRLVDRLLELARLDLRREALLTAPRPEVLDLAEVVADVTAALRPLARERAVDLETVETAPATSTSLRADRHVLETVLGNLVENALKYTQAGGLVTVEVSAADGLNPPSVTVTDNGPGIAPEHLPHIFERFYRVDKARSRATGGAGLGLAIAAEAAALLGGRIDVSSEVGRGSRFTLVLPPAAEAGFNRSVKLS